MKQIILLLIFSCSVLLSYSQVQPANPSKFSMNYKGYSIHLIIGERGTFGYDIVQGNKIVLHQVHNPFNRSLPALSNPDDAFKIAQWQIDHSPVNPAIVMASNRRISGLENLSPAIQQRLNALNAKAVHPLRSRVPMSVAEQLKIKLDTH